MTQKCTALRYSHNVIVNQTVRNIQSFGIHINKNFSVQTVRPINLFLLNVLPIMKRIQNGPEGIVHVLVLQICTYLSNSLQKLCH